MIFFLAPTGQFLLGFYYYGENLASGYARGIDLKINGEFVEGIQSYASLSWLQTKEDIKNDFYYEYFNQEGEKIIPGYTIDQNVADSTRYEPGLIPRPTDQRLSFSMFFQIENVPGINGNEIFRETPGNSRVAALVVVFFPQPQKSQQFPFDWPWIMQGDISNFI